MAALWPIGLPQKTLKDGFSKLPRTNVISTANDRGPNTIRVVGTTAYIDYRVIFRMTTAEVAIFETFFYTTLVSGSLEFQWNDPLTGVAYFWTIDQPTGQSPYALTNLGGEVYNIAFTVTRKDPV